MTGIKTKVEVEVEVPRDWLELRICARACLKSSEGLQNP